MSKERDLIAANKFRDSILHKRDGFNSVFPYFYGWVIVDSYLAGLEAGRKEQHKKRARRK